MKIIHTVAKVLLSLLLVMPIVGAIGLMPAPTRDLYTNDTAYQFINIMMTTHYISYMMAVVFALALYFLWTKREAVAAVLVLPVTLNIVGFHYFLDGGPFTGGAVMGNIMLALNAYFLWIHRQKFSNFIKK